MKVLAIVLGMLTASVGCGGSPCKELEKVDCSKAKDPQECTSWKQMGLKDGSKDGCQASLDASSVKSAMSK